MGVCRSEFERCRKAVEVKAETEMCGRPIRYHGPPITRRTADAGCGDEFDRICIFGTVPARYWLRNLMLVGKLEMEL